PRRTPGSSLPTGRWAPRSPRHRNRRSSWPRLSSCALVRLSEFTVSCWCSGTCWPSTPALLKARSSRPNSLTARSTSALASAGLLTSVGWKTAPPPAGLMVVPTAPPLAAPPLPTTRAAPALAWHSRPYISGLQKPDLYGASPSKPPGVVWLQGCQQLLQGVEVERLDHVMVEPRCLSLAAVLVAAIPGQRHQHRPGEFRSGPQVPGHGEAVHAR